MPRRSGEPKPGADEPADVDEAQEARDALAALVTTAKHEDCEAVAKDAACRNTAAMLELKSVQLLRTAHARLEEKIADRAAADETTPPAEVADDDTPFEPPAGGAE